MLKNYFKTAVRSLIRNKSYSLINITGLAAGILVCLVIFIILSYELSFENYHTKKDRIYRVLTEYHHADADMFYGRGIPRALPAAMKTQFSQVEKAAVLHTEHDPQIQVLDDAGRTVKKFKEKTVTVTDPSLFDIFNFTWLAGNGASLKDPNNVVLSRAMANKYFGDWKTATGKTIRWNNGDVLRVTGVLENSPPNTDLQMDIVIAFGTGYTARWVNSSNWDGTSQSFGCFVLLRPGVSEAAMNTQLRALAKKMKSPDNKDSHILQALQKIHFDTQAGTVNNKTISPQLIQALWLIAAFILLIACVNFVNLATAQAVNRSKEIGVRKVLGSNALQLKGQFIAETFVIVLTAVVLAVLLSILALPAVGKLLDLPLSAYMLQQPVIAYFLLALLIVVTALAGFYPSVVLSRFNPINVLKNSVTAISSKGISLRRALVVFQFFIAQALIIGTLIMAKQMNYFTSQPLGFEKDAVVNIPYPNDSAGISKLTQLRSNLAALNGIRRVSFNSTTPVEDGNDNWTKIVFNNAPKETDFYSIDKIVDHEYLPTYELSLVAGRNIMASDTTREFLINETLMKALGITNPQEILGKEISLGEGSKGTITGVLKDFHDRSFRAGVAPVLMHSMKNWCNQAGIKLAAGNAPATLQAIEKVWNTTFPDFVFEYQFLDDKVANFYKGENKLSNLYQVFAVIAIFLSCLGLYGLASFMAVQRTREVGIRKVLGATATNIVYLFSKEFVLLIAIAFVLATPVAWYFMNQWLQNYTYRTDASWWIFGLGGIAAIGIALVTVSAKAIKAALANPVKSLRSE